MDCSRLGLSIPRVIHSPTGGATHVYCLTVVYGKLQWEIQHRFSAFWTLNDVLQNNCQLEALPPPPPKSVLRPQDTATLEERRIMLQNWIRLLCSRPDIRTSGPFLDFIEFELHTGTAVQPLAPCVTATAADDKLHLSDFNWSSETQSVLSCYQESASMARVGKVWSLIENDELGGLTQWELHWDIQQPQAAHALPQQPPGYYSPMDFNKDSLFQAPSTVQHPFPPNYYSTTSAMPPDLALDVAGSFPNFEKRASVLTPVRIRCLYFHAPTQRVFAGAETGVLFVYSVPPTQYQHDHAQIAWPTGSNTVPPNVFPFNPHELLITHTSTTFPTTLPDQNPNNLQNASAVVQGLAKEAELPLHRESILTLRGDGSNGDRIVSIGFDKAVRIVHCATLETLSGGKLDKRLDFREQLASVALEEPKYATNLPDASLEGPSATPASQTSTAPSLRPLEPTRLFVGTSKGKVFIFNSASNPPQHLHTLIVDPTGTNSIGALEVAGYNILVAHKYSLSIYRIGNIGEESRATCVATLQSNLSFGRTIQSIAVSVTTPLLFLGHTRAITMWDCHSRSCIAAFKAHFRGVRRLAVLENTKQFTAGTHCNAPSITTHNPMLLSGGGDGRLKLWSLGPYADYTVWQQPTLEHTSTNDASNLAAYSGESTINFTSQHLGSGSSRPPADTPSSLQHNTPNVIPSPSCNPPTQQILPDNQEPAVITEPSLVTPAVTHVSDNIVNVPQSAHGKSKKLDFFGSPQKILSTSTPGTCLTNQVGQAIAPQTSYPMLHFEDDDEDATSLVCTDFTSAMPHRH